MSQFYLLIGETSHEESQLFMTSDTLEAAKAAAVEVEAMTATVSINSAEFPFSERLSIYECQLGYKPKAILTASFERRRSEPYTSHRELGDWKEYDWSWL